MRITADVDVRGAIAEVRRVRGEFPDKAIAQALNRTATTVRARAAREISKRMGPPFAINKVRRFIHIEKARKTSLIVTIRGRGRAEINLAWYQSRQTSTGMAVRVGGRTLTIEHAFFPRAGGKFLRGANAGELFTKKIFIRGTTNKKTLYTKAVYRPGGKRFPIQSLTAPGIPTVFQERVVDQILRGVVAERFPIELDKAAVNALRRLQ